MRMGLDWEMMSKVFSTSLFMADIILIQLYNLFCQSTPKGLRCNQMRHNGISHEICQLIAPLLFISSKTHQSVILILLMLVQASLLTQISTTNLLTVTISQTKLENNFELILKALKSHESSLGNLASRMTGVQASVKKSEQKRASDEQKQALLQEQLKRIESELGEMKDQMNGLQRFKKEMSAKMQDSIINPESKKEKEDQYNEHQQAIKLLQQQIDKLQAKVNTHDAYDKRITDLQRDLKEQTAKITRLEDSVKEIEKVSNKLKSASQNQLTQDIIKKMLSQLQGSIQAKTNDKIKSLRKETQGEIEKLNDKINDIKSQIGKMGETLNDQSKGLKKCSQDIWKLNQQMYKLELEQKSTISNSLDAKKISELEKRVKKLEDSLNLSKVSNYEMTANKTQNSPTKNEKEEMNLSHIKEESTTQDKTNFKQQIIDKLKQQKGDFNKALKKLDTITLKKDEDKQRIGHLEEKVLRVEHILDGKVDDEGMKKWMRYIQNKIAYLYRIVNVDVPEEDACIARKNWICLSCDKNLDTYKGKLGNHLVSAQMKGKPIENEVIGGGMLFRSKSRYQIPSVKK